jgi:hypothetical protein
LQKRYFLIEPNIQGIYIPPINYMCMTGLVAHQTEDFSISLKQVAEHLYFNLPSKQSFEEHVEHARKVVDYLLEKGLIEIDARENIRARLKIEGHTLPELIHRAANDINLKI